jgi:HSP20 family protein
MALIRWTPNRELVGFQDEVNRLFNELWAPATTRALLPAGWVPAVDVNETDQGYEFQLDLPGIDPANLKIQVTGDQLTIHGERRAVKNGDAKSIAHRVERATGAFERSFTLPTPVETDQVKASYKDGVLTVRLPKAASAVARQVTIDVG